MRNNIREQSRTIREKQGSCKELTATCEDRTQRLSSAEQLVSASVASQPRFLNPPGEPWLGQVLAHHTGPQGTPLRCPYPLMTAEYVLHLGTWWKDVIRPHCCSVYPFTSFEMSILDLELHGILDERGLCSYWYWGYRFHEKKCNLKSSRTGQNRNSRSHGGAQQQIASILFRMVLHATWILAHVLSSQNCFPGCR